MILKEYLKRAPNNKVLYIGAQSGFFVGGYLHKPLTVMEDTFPPITESIVKISRELAEKHNEKERKRIERSKSIEEKETEIPETPVPFVPLLKRQVLEVYDRAEENAQNIIIEGCEYGDVWSLYEKVPYEVRGNVDQITAAVYREVVKKYKTLFRQEIRTFALLLDRLIEYEENSRHQEWYIRFLGGEETKVLRSGEKVKHPSKLFTLANPERIIYQARKEVIEALMEEKQCTNTHAKTQESVSDESTENVSS